MAQYFTDFSEYTTGVQPSDWTERWHTDADFTVEADAGATGGKRLEAVAVAAQRHFLSWDAIDSDADRDDIEILARFMLSTTAPSSLGVLAARGSGTDTTENALKTELDGGNTYAGKYTAGSYVSIGNNPDGYSQDVWMWIRARWVGSAVQVSRWTGAVGDEPGAWEIDETDTGITGVGWAGVMTWALDEMYWDVVGIGTNGDSAPSESTGNTTAAALSGGANITATAEKHISQVLRPASTITAGSWDTGPTPGQSLDGYTSDESDATYIEDTTV
jgi:hypothetical protein